MNEFLKIIEILLAKQKLNYDKKNNEMQDEINVLKTTSIPIGFLYTQLPNQSSPIDLWPKTN